VRVIKQTIATLLAIQLFIAFGLCGTLCCVPAQTEEVAETASQTHPHQSPQTGSHSNHHQPSQPATAKSHCHTKAETSEQSSKQPGQTGAKVLSRIQPVQSAHHFHNNQSAGQSIAVTSNQHCRCSISGQESLAASLKRIDSSPQKDKQFALASLPSWQVDQAPPLPSISPPTSLSHAPPFGGFRFSLRI
jgi:hypothetical protein